MCNRPLCVFVLYRLQKQERDTEVVLIVTMTTLKHTMSPLGEYKAPLK